MCGRVDCFFFNDTATTEIYTLSLHDALPICVPLDRIAQLTAELEQRREGEIDDLDAVLIRLLLQDYTVADRKSTRLNSSHANISYAVFCLKKKRNAGVTGELKHMLCTLMHFT